MSSGEGGAEEPQGEQAPEEQEHQRKEDPELKALKEEIAALEKTFGEKKSALEYALEQCEEYSKTGYARKVAEMENMRRVRSVSQVMVTFDVIFFVWCLTICFVA
jgi:molecular chaperone GrpE (heat shock protein)